MLRDADVLLIVPPFAWQDRPALGVHVLQAIARRAGIEAQVLYTNFLFTRFFDQGTHDTFAQMQYGLYLGERLFARAALGTPPLGEDRGAGIVQTLDKLAAAFARMGVHSTFTFDAILRVEAKIDAWLDSFVPQIAARGYRVVGCTSSFEQTLSSVAMLARIKRASPATTTIIGGANCEDEMAEGVAALDPAIDHVFSGESEATFARFLAGELRERIVRGAPCNDLDALPSPDFRDYFEQHAAVLGRRATTISYETSRGCWWGAKSHCTFCGLNGQGMASRAKSAERVLADLRAITAQHGVTRVTMTDNIMPHEYWKTLVPRLASELPGMRIMYEQKANLGLRQVRDLVRAGIVEIQPGIEALSTGLLKLMAKGTTAAQNIALLRHAKAAGLLVQWNLLHGFPGEDLACYAETLEVIRLIHHLQPPVSPCPVVVDRFSPYFMEPAKYGISELRPFAFYEGVLPARVPLRKLAYHFEGTFESASRARPELVRELADAVTAWRRAFYAAAPPRLEVERRGDGYVLVDTRGLPESVRERSLDEAQAIAALIPRTARGADRASYMWALDQGVVIERDGKLVPLATADPDLVLSLEEQARRPSDLLLAI